MPFRPLVVGLVLAFEYAALDDAELELVEPDLLMPARRALLRHGDAVGVAVRAHVGVQPLDVHGVERVLLALEPVARYLRNGDVADGVVPEQVLPAGEERRGLRAHVGEHEPRHLAYGVARDLDLLLEASVRVDGLLEGLLDALAGLVHHPAVVHATEAVLLGDAVGEVDAPVGAEAFDEAEGSGPVAVEDEVLAEQP